MVNDAIKKITEEAMALNTPIAIAIEEHLTNKCTNEATAQKLLAADKSLKELINQIEKEARSKAVGNCAVLADSEVYHMVDTYYALNKTEDAPIDTTNVLDLL